MSNMDKGATLTQQQQQNPNAGQDLNLNGPQVCGPKPLEFRHESGCDAKERQFREGEVEVRRVVLGTLLRVLLQRLLEETEGGMRWRWK
ncbi:hypothetical protein E2542_SST24735 [Spatholobus suberectus]|nr:hypothetical protein E2542_SST24735 [Spatholobus suberectus]